MYAFNTARGNIHLEFHSSQEADDVFISWHEIILGANTLVRKPSSPEQPNRSVLVRGVPVEIAEETIIDSLAQEFSNVRATRFVKRDKTVLRTVRLTFSSAEDAAKAKNQGVLLTIFSTDLLTSYNQELKTLDFITAWNLDTWAQTVNLKNIADTAARNITPGNARTNNILTPRVETAVIIIGLTHMIASFTWTKFKVYNARDIPLPKSVLKALQNNNETKNSYICTVEHLCYNWS